MASQSDEISDEENGNNSDIDPIEVAIDAVSKPASASISRKRKIHPREQATFLNFGGNFLIFEQL